MSSSQRTLFPALLVLGLIILAAYWLFTNLNTSPTDPAPDDTITVIEPAEPIINIENNAASTQKAVIDQEANSFINALSQPQDSSTVIDENKDQFVRHDATIILPRLEQRTTTISDLLADKSLAPETPIILNINSKVEQKTTLAELSDKLDQQSTVITLIDQTGQTKTQPLYDFLNQENASLTRPITRLVEQQQQITTTIEALPTLNNIDQQQPLIAIIEQATQQVAIKDIISSEERADDALYYLHRVTASDHQGLWGIIQSGLTDKFREGVRLKGIYSNKDRVKAIIPADADEKLTSGISSFLGKILNQKVNSSYIYNFNSQIMSRDPNQIYPGQQLVLIHFSVEELNQIYHFFSQKRQQNTQTFGIEN